MKKTTLCFCLNNDEVLLAMKKRGFGAGKWNGYGGKVDTGETECVAAIRELKEESGLITTEETLQKVALIGFYFDNNLVFECTVYTTHNWKNEPIETEEMRPQWFKLNNLPYSQMWAADAKWIPLILEGKRIEADVYFNTDGSKVEDFKYKLSNFN